MLLHIIPPFELFVLALLCLDAGIPRDSRCEPSERQQSDDRASDPCDGIEGEKRKLASRDCKHLARCCADRNHHEWAEGIPSDPLIERAQTDPEFARQLGRQLKENQNVVTSEPVASGSTE